MIYVYPPRISPHQSNNLSLYNRLMDDDCAYLDHIKSRILSPDPAKCAGKKSRCFVQTPPCARLKFQCGELQKSLFPCQTMLRNAKYKMTTKKANQKILASLIIRKSRQFSDFQWNIFLSLDKILEPLQVDCLRWRKIRLAATKSNE